MTHGTSGKRRQFGIVAADPLRLLGFQSLFPPASGVDLVPLVQPTAKVLKEMSLVVVDGSSAELLFETIAALRQASPAICLIVVGLSADPAFVQSIIGAGVKGYLTHGATEAEIRMAVDIVLDGSVWAPRKVLARLIEKQHTGIEQPRPQPSLTPRETDVLRLLVRGSSNKEIGADLAIDAATVKAHVGRLLRKLNVPNRTSLSMEAMKQHLLD